MDLHASSTCLDTVERFSEGKWQKVANLGTTMMHAGACTFPRSPMSSQSNSSEAESEFQQTPGETETSCDETVASNSNHSEDAIYIVGGCLKTANPPATTSNGNMYQITKPLSATSSMYATKELPIVGGCFSSPRTGAAIAQQGSHMYIIGGCVHHKNKHRHAMPLSSMMCYDSTADTWEPLPGMKNSRYGASAVVHNDKIYVIGGVFVDMPIKAIGGNRRAYCTKHVEIYDIKRQTWSKGASLRQARTATTAVVFQGRIHVLGGYHFVPLKTVESYNEEKDCWEKCPPMRRPRAGATAAVIELPNQSWVGAGSLQRKAKRKPKGKKKAERIKPE